MGRRTRIAAIALVALLVPTFAHVLWRRWELTASLVVAVGVVVAAVATRRAIQKIDQLEKAQQAASRRDRQTLKAARDTAESIRALREDALRYADASGRQHATIDHRVVTLHAQAAKQTADLATALSRASQDLSDATGDLSRLHTAVAALSTDVRQTRAEMHKLRPKPRTAPSTSSVLGQELITDLRPTCVTPSVNLVLHAFTPAQLFAGVKTALLAGVHTAVQARRPLRLIILTEPSGDGRRTRDEVAQWIASEAGHPEVVEHLSITTRSHAQMPGYHPEDVWIATYWTTAVALQRAVELGHFSPDRVMYLVQDWEPGFMAWGTEHALARDTYRAGFRMVVNSAPLADYVAGQTGLEIPESRVFSPQVDEERLHSAATRWTPRDPDQPRVLVYLRPSKPRNLSTMALDTLRLWAERLPDSVRPIVHLAGEDMAPLDLGPRLDVVMSGKTNLDAYYRLLAETDLGLALMFSPHPSHLPLELPMAGIPTVTNALDDVRRPWVKGLRVAPASPQRLAQALTAAWEESRQLTRHTPQPRPLALGGDLDVAVRAAIADLL